MKHNQHIEKIELELQRAKTARNPKAAVRDLWLYLSDVMSGNENKQILRYDYDTMFSDIYTTPEGFAPAIKGLKDHFLWRVGRYNVIAARTSQGKTTFMRQDCVVNAMKYSDTIVNKSFLYLSLEDPQHITASQMAHVLNSYFDFRGNITTYKNYETIKNEIKNDTYILKNALKAILEKTLIIRYGNYDIKTIRAIIQKAYQDEKALGREIKVCYLDYIQKIHGKERDLYTRLRDISAQIPYISSDTGIPIVVGAQLGRGAKSNKSADDVLRLDNIKNCGDIEQDAQVVLGIFNEDKANEQHGGATQERRRYYRLLLSVLKNSEGATPRNLPYTHDVISGMMFPGHRDI